METIIRLHQMHELQTIVTDVRGVCLSVNLSRGSTQLHRVGSFGAIFAKSLWPLVFPFFAFGVFGIVWLFMRFIALFLILHAYQIVSSVLCASCCERNSFRRSCFCMKQS